MATKNNRAKKSITATSDEASCRVCMNRKLNMKYLFDEANNNIIDKIKFCTGIQLQNQDGIPTHICSVCLRNLSIAHKFKTICLLAEKTFRSLVQKIKIEVPNSDTDQDSFNDCVNDNEENNDNDIEEKKMLEFDVGIKTEVDIKKDETDSCNITIVKIKKSVPEAIKRRGQYKKAGPPSRLKKYKFRKLFCEMCDLKFKTKQESDDHKKDKHKGNDDWVCEICGKKFVHRASLYTHVRSHLPPQFACEHCDYRTSNKYDLVKHVRIHTGDKRYKCDQCACAYHNASNLRQHKRRQHELMRRLPCPRPRCDKTFYDSSKLNRHLDSHDDVKRYVCDVCHSRFARRCHWKKHMLRQHAVNVPAQRPGRQKEIFIIRAGGDA